MNGIPWILVSILLALVVLGIAAVVLVRRRKQPRRVDYRNYFVIGVVWIPTGLVLTFLPLLLHGEEPFFMGLVFLMIGLAYAIVGLVNRDKWGKQAEISHATSRSVLVLVVAVGVLLVLGLAAFAFLR